MTKKLSEDYNLAICFPEIAKEWHPTKNGNLKPNQCYPSAHKRVWWVCKHDHIWDQTINSRTNDKSGCPYCSGRRVGYGNDFESEYPEIAKEWHPTKNGNLKPSQFVSGSHKRMWWKCKYEHEWMTSFLKRKKTNCPKCSNQTSRPELYIFSELSSIFNDVKNREKFDNIEVDIFIKDFNIAIEYDGYFFHQNRKKDRVKKDKIKKNFLLLNIREKPLEKIYENDYLYNFHTDYYKLVVDILKHIISKKICKSKEFISLAKRYIKEKKPRNEEFFKKAISFLPVPLIEDSLQFNYPEVSKQWHPTKNSNLTPRNFRPGSNWKAYWMCDKNHEWISEIASRTMIYKKSGKTSCPYCSGRRVGYSNDFESEYPEIAKEWHPTKNGNLKPSQFVSGSHKRVWWKCKNNHEWKVSINTRTKNKSVCHNCELIDKSLESEYPEIAKEWHPTKNGNLKPNQIKKGSGKIVWWKCKNNHEWKVSINNRTSSGSICRECYVEEMRGNIPNRKRNDDGTFK